MVRQTLYDWVLIIEQRKKMEKKTQELTHISEKNNKKICLEKDISQNENFFFNFFIKYQIEERLWESREIV